MRGPDRPTREQVEATLRVALDGNGDRHDARLLAAELRALACRPGHHPDRRRGPAMTTNTQLVECAPPDPGWALDVFVAGRPAPQGSIRAKFGRLL